MAKSFPIPAFQENKANSIGFNLVTQVNSFNSVFDTQPLEQHEVNKIEQLFIDSCQTGSVVESQIKKDMEQIKKLTSEIKAIGRQGVILMGERIHQAREILKSYKDGTFIKWIDSTFESRSTAYNMLSYYELYLSLPSFAKEELKKLPQKAAYILASRNGDTTKKANFIKNFYHLKTDEIIALIREHFPSFTRTSKNENSRLLENVQEAIKILKSKKNELSEFDKHELLSLKLIIEDILTGFPSLEISPSK